MFEVYEVFLQTSWDEPHRHVGSLNAPSPDIALVMAKENFVRRDPCVNLWVVPRRAVTATSYEDQDVFAFTTDRTYRLREGYVDKRKKFPKMGKETFAIEELRQFNDARPVTAAVRTDAAARGGKEDRHGGK